MARIACVDLPAFPLQLLLRDHPDWGSTPAVVVADDRPQGRILWANAEARATRVLPGMTFAAGRALAAHLNAGVIEAERIDEAVAELFEQLSQFTPRVEPVAHSPGSLFLDPSGMTPLYTDLEQWSHAIHQSLDARGYRTAVAVGSQRFSTWALARCIRGVRLWHDPRIEARDAASVPLARLEVPPRLRDELALLGISRLGQFIALPYSEVYTRFGAEAAKLHAEASGDSEAPLQPRPLVEPVTALVALEPPQSNVDRVLHVLEPALRGLMAQLAERHQALAVLQLDLKLDHAPGLTQRLEPAAPDLDVEGMMQLLRLRLESLQLPAAIEELGLTAEGVDTTAGQLELFRTRARRDLDAANRALARIRASFGDEAVTIAELRPAHLPEGRFTWVPTCTQTFPQNAAASKEEALEIASNETPPLVRQLFAKPTPLPDRPRHEPERWLAPRGAVTHMQGPYRVAGGWWHKAVERDYYYVHTQRGDILWMFFDRQRRRWFLHGLVG